MKMKTRLNKKLKIFIKIEKQIARPEENDYLSIDFVYIMLYLNLFFINFTETKTHFFYFNVNFLFFWYSNTVVIVLLV